MEFETQAVHAGDRKKPTDAIPSTTPIVSATTYIYENAEQLEKIFADERDGLTYSRYGTTTVTGLEELVATLEGAEAAIATSSGMAAIHLAVMTALTDRPRRVVAAKQLYGTTMQMLTKVLGQHNIDTVFADPCDFDAFAECVREEPTGCVLLESVSNPLVRVPPLDRIAELATEVVAPVVVDATFTTPYIMRPIELGCDFSVSSSTKFLAGHGDALGGVVAMKQEHMPIARTLHRIYGGTMGALEAYLTMRGIKTLALRMDRQCANAAAVAESLRAHPAVEAVHWSGFADHPDVDTIRRLLPEGKTGAMVSFAIRDAGRDDVYAFLNALKLVVRGTSLGDIHSLISYPAASSHRELSPKHRARLGIGDNLVRLSVGAEAVEDITGDLARALEVVKGAPLPVNAE